MKMSDVLGGANALLRQAPEGSVIVAQHFYSGDPHLPQIEGDLHRRIL